MRASLPSDVLGIPLWAVIAGAATALAVARDAWRAGEARAVVDRWAARHDYRLVACRRAWLAGIGLRYTGVRLGQDEDAVQHGHLYVFAVTVADRALGGRSRGRVAVRSTASGFDEDVEIAWDELNVPDDTAPAGPAWEEPQLALLRRVGAGECGFRPEDRTDAAGARFDMLVEHLMAMQRRGWVTLGTPAAEMRRPGRTYAAVGDVELTDAGREVLARTGRGS